jgi:ribosome biogenesis protein UTP30
MRLIQTLGKTFFKSSKRPIPIRIEEIQKVNGKRVKKDAKKRPATDDKYAAVAAPDVVAREIERTLSAVPVHLAPATTAAVRVGLSSFTEQQLAENIQAVVGGITEKYVTKGWRNVKAIHVKGPKTTALPIWLSSELWLEEGDVRENVVEDETKAIEGAKKGGKKRKSNAGDTEERKLKKAKAVGNDDDEEAKLIASRRKKLQDQKAKASLETADDAIKIPSTEATDGKSKSKKKRKSAV